MNDLPSMQAISLSRGRPSPNGSLRRAARGLPAVLTTMLLLSCGEGTPVDPAESTPVDPQDPQDPEPVLAVSPTDLSMSAAAGAAEPVTATVSVDNDGDGALNGLSASEEYVSGGAAGWLAATLSTTSAPATLTVTASASALAAGTYEAVVQITSATAVNSPQSIDVTYTVGSAGPPDLVVSGLSVSPSSVVAGGNVAVESFALTNQGQSDAEAVDNGFYLSSDATITADDTRLTGISHPLIEAGDAVVVEAFAVQIPDDTPPGSYHFGFLADEADTVEESDETNNDQSVSVTVTEPSADSYTLTVASNIASAGNVSADPAGPTHGGGTVVEVTATPEEGFTFSHWSGDAGGSANPVGVTMDADKSVTANFELVAPTLSASSVSSGTFTLSFAFPWPCPDLCFGSSQDRYEVEQSTTSPTSGFSVVATMYGRTSPESVELTRDPGTYYYRVRVIDDAAYGVSPYSAVRTVIVNEEPTGATELRIINDLPGIVAGPNDWGKLNTILRVRIGSTQDAVLNLTGDAQELLYPLDAAYSVADLVDIQPGEEMTLDIPAYQDTYWLFIQTGWWEYTAFTDSWDKHMAAVLNCVQDVGYKWTTIQVVEPFGHPEVIRASDFLPDGHWYGSQYC